MPSSTIRPSRLLMVSPVQITNFGTNGDGFTWAGSATETTDPVQISGTGLVTVTGVAPWHSVKGHDHRDEDQLRARQRTHNRQVAGSRA